MERNIIIHPLAGMELRTASRSYRAVSATTEQRFRVAVHQTFGRIALNAEGCPPYGKRFRWTKPRRFPYIVYLEILSDLNVIVYAVGHERRRPGYWRRRIKKP
jgi:hypothetical protein